jgi:uncharacterized membrane protein required for colicin V production
MIAAAANTASSIANNLSVSWFDLVFVVVLGFGLFRGRRNGLSRELIPLLQWIALVIAAGMGYPTVAQFETTQFHWGKTIADVSGYLALALVTLIFFAIVKRTFTERLVKNDTFKGMEYYLGMPAGMIRFACMLLAVLALMNAPLYTPEEISAQKARDKATYGGGMMSGSFFPSFDDIQQQIFADSFTGRYIKNNLKLLLIDPLRLTVVHKKPPPIMGN